MTFPTGSTMDMRSKLSTLWIFATLNYLYCDVAGLMDRDLLTGYLAGNVNGLEISQGFLLGAGILVEIPIAMVLLSRVLEYRANRWANVAAGTVMTVVQLATLFLGGSPTMYYLFFSVIEIATTAFIVWSAWKWSETAAPIDQSDIALPAPADAPVPGV
jgi:hypothetical protein